MSSALTWYAIYTRSRYEKLVAASLSRKGFETLLPLATRRLPVSRLRSRESQIPLFPSYVFSRCAPNPEDHYRIRGTEGVVYIVGTDGTPIGIPDEEVESLRKLQTNMIECIPMTSFSSGQRVVVLTGPLAGLRGEVLRRKNQRILVVKISLIRRMLQVDFDPDNLELAGR